MPRCWPPPRSSSRSPSRPCSPSLTWRRALRRGTTSSDTRFIGAFQQTSRLQRLIERQRPCTAHAARYFELIRERLGELVADGLEEAFLVRSVRDAIRRQLESLPVDPAHGLRRAIRSTPPCSWVRPGVPPAHRDPASVRRCYRAQLLSPGTRGQPVGSDDSPQR